ncbi:hypothetical protein SNEBB_006236 [Seison nebaliae]|nr:hypothetical protein SNEBB_006236 [Seison nebaliae]
MNSIHDFWTQSFANYFAQLPLPKTFGGFFHLSLSDWGRLLPFFGVTVGIGYLGYYHYDTRQQINRCNQSIINRSIQLSKEKVVDIVDVEDIGEKKAFCRCWKSKKFPYCDGAHNQHNAATGDNVGPLVVKE